MMYPYSSANFQSHLKIAALKRVLFDLRFRWPRQWCADSKGWACSHDLIGADNCCRKEMDPNNEESQVIGPYSCVTCDPAYACCIEYSLCVTCCLNATKEAIFGTVASRVSLSKSGKLTVPTEIVKEMDPKGIYKQQFSNIFSFCAFKCLTTSKSVVHENAFRTKRKYCFGTKAPPLETS